MIFEDFSTKTDKELYERLMNLNEKAVHAYSLGMNPVFVEQLQISIETIQNVLQERQFMESWEKNKEKLQSPIETDVKKEEGSNAILNRRKRQRNGRRRIPTV